MGLIADRLNAISNCADSDNKSDNTRLTMISELMYIIFLPDNTTILIFSNTISCFKSRKNHLKTIVFLLNQNSIPEHFHNSYKKWFRFYLDFCKKYKYVYADKNSLDFFWGKLFEKNQTDTQKSQVYETVQFYFSGLKSKPPLVEPGNHVKQTVFCFQTDKEMSSWNNALSDMGNEIKRRHYSPKTFNSYTLWAKRLKRYIKEVESPLDF